ncbi:ferrichrome ABC transporter substrate-binding protein [Paenibacillus sp. Leaf72]|nr:ferrichrome ABC transporter substrate-binding protein [Paenibacillus sp. Leaf72]
MLRWGKKRFKSKMTALMLVALAVIIALAGCGSQGETAVNKGASDAAATVSPSPAAAEEPAAAEQEAETRVLQDEFGEVTVPAHPKRVAALYLEDYLTALGVTPVVQWYHPLWGTQEYLKLDLPTFDITGDIEVLLDMEPDLIILDGWADKAKYDLFSKIAPTYRLPENILFDSKAILTTIADVMNMKEQGETVINAYEQKIADAKDKLNTALGDESVAVIRLNVDDSTFALFGVNNRFIGSLYSQLGLTPNTWSKDMEEFQKILTEESLPDLDADHIIILLSNGTWDSPENQEALKLLDSSMWKAIPAVKAGHVHRVERSYWQSGAITANSMKIDDILKMFVK